MDKQTKILIVVTIVIFMALGAVLGIKVYNKNKSGQDVKTEIKEVEEVAEEEPVPEKKKEEIKIFQGNDRPIAFMIDNNVNAQPQSALNQAYLVYEIIVEGGESRLMALFKGVDVSGNDVTVGPIRSARHYFIDYALENDAIYAHLGQSPQAEEYIKNFNVSDINGQIYDTGKARTGTSLYWREKSKKAPHNAYTSIKSILEICQKKNYKTTSNKESVLHYVAEEVKFADTAISASKISIPYGTNHTVQYVYDEAKGRYTRYSKGKKQVDEQTGEDVTTKNIIVTFIRNTTLDDGEGKGRQELDNFTNAKGYYITNGKAIKITCKKQNVGGQTKYVDEAGNEINVNDGNTWINICPIDSNVTFE